MAADYERQLQQLVQNKLVRLVRVLGPDQVELHMHDGALVLLTAETESMTGRPYQHLTWNVVGALAQDAGQAAHVIHNIEAVWYQDRTTELRPQQELLAAARADIRTLLRYALPGVYGEDAAVQAAEAAAAMWREVHDALQQVNATSEYATLDAYDPAVYALATARYEAARQQLHSAGLLAVPPAVAQGARDSVDVLLAPPPVPVVDDTQWRRVVGSSNVAALAYLGGHMYAKFKDGRTYQYHDVASETWQGLLATYEAGDSVGSYLSTQLAPLHKVVEAADPFPAA